MWIAVVLLVTLAIPGPPPRLEASNQPPLYRVTLAAPDRAARGALASNGVAIDAVGPGTVTTFVDEAGLARIRKQGIVPLAVIPLDFPPTDSAYHNYGELLSEIDAIAAAHPDIVRVIGIGTSLEGRDLLAVKISDEPELDDPSEPAVMFMALTHAREHLTVEMALSILRLFTEGYGSDPALTNLVNQREIWVLPNNNPDGGEYDIVVGNYLWWRKNRRLNSDGSFGVDLNRNYDYRWGGIGSSSYPGSETYRGPAAFSEPETQAVRDFVVAHADITTAISFHTYGELILYPYAYTYVDVPADMDPLDHQAFVTLADRMAVTNGYSDAQASDLYPTTGDTTDWLYGERRIFGFTFEMFPPNDPPGFYPSASVIERETQRNIEAVTYLTTVADHPRKVIGDGGDVTAPTVLLSPPPEPLMAGAPISLTATYSDDVGTTLVGWQVDGSTISLNTTPPFTGIWTFAAPGFYSVNALAYDAGGNMGAGEPLTLGINALAQAGLTLQSPTNAPLTAPLHLTFTHPITVSTLALTLTPPLALAVQPSADGGADITHAPFQPATTYTLTLAAGRGPLAVLAPDVWTFTTSERRAKYFPLIGFGG